jgi:hypothetical protein
VGGHEENTTMGLPTNDTDRAIDYLEGHHRDNDFLASVYRYYRVHHTLTPGQVEAVLRLRDSRRGR